MRSRLLIRLCKEHLGSLGLGATRALVVSLFLVSLGESGCIRSRTPPSTLAPGTQATGSLEGEAPRPGASGAGRARLQVSAGAGHSCALVADGKLYCWGDNQQGQLGDGTTRSRQAAGAVRGPNQLVAVSTGNAHTCGIDRQAQLWCWGDNRFGQLGLGSASLKRDIVPSPTRVGSISGQVRSVVAGERHTCAITRDNTLYCWGDNARGQLGHAAPTIFSQPVQVQGVGRVKQVALGSGHSCVLRSDQVVLCWGDNRQGQLGTQNPQMRHRPARLAGLAKASMIAAGADKSCAASAAGVFCWGRASGNGQPHLVKRVTSIGDVAQLSVGASNGCLVDKEQRPFCWGRNDEGQLGDGGTRDSAQPRPLAGLRKALALSVGPRHSCAVGGDGKIYCWGSDGFAALGSPANQASKVSSDFRRTLMLTPSRDVASGEKFACALGDEGRVYCWGDNARGQLGNGSQTAYSAIPSPVQGITDAVQVVAGAHHACALRKGGMVQCWGSNLARQLGGSNGGAKVSRLPVTVTKIRDAVHLAAGHAFSCAATKQGQVWCWGASNRGQLGHLSGGFAPVAALRGAQRVYAGAEHACAKDRAGNIYCWGDNSQGQLGSNGGARVLDKPVARAELVRGVSGVGQVALGERFSCVVAKGGRVYCWGDNRRGQIGNGTASDVWMMPVPVASIRNVRSLGAGTNHICADQGDWIYCWGQVPPGGSVGTQTMQARKPVRAVATRARQIVGGTNFSCALDAQGDVGCWGQERAGELGRGMRGFSNRAVPVTGL